MIIIFYYYASLFALNLITTYSGIKCRSLANIVKHDVDIMPWELGLTPQNMDTSLHSQTRAMILES